MNSFQVQITNEAFLDLLQIHSYISNELLAPEIADKQVDRIRKGINSLKLFPLRNQVVLFEPWRSKQIRQMVVDNFIVYYLTNEESKMISILRVFYGKRNIESIINKD